MEFFATAAFGLEGLVRRELNQLGLEAKGLMIRYGGMGSWLQEAAAALAGPLAGLLYGILLLPAEGTLPEWLSVSGSVSLMLTGFNLLPILPLDGGRLLLHLSSAVLGDAAGRRLTERLSLAVGCAMLAAGIWLLLRGLGAALLLGAVWLLLCQESPRGLVKKRQIV